MNRHTERKAARERDDVTEEMRKSPDYGQMEREQRRLGGPSLLSFSLYLHGAYTWTWSKAVYWQGRPEAERVFFLFFWTDGRMEP